MNDILRNFNDEQTQSSFQTADIQQYKWVAVLGYFIPILFFLPIVVNGNSSYCKFHANNQLTWFIISIVIGIVNGILGLIPILGILTTLVISLAQLALLIALVYGVAKDMALKFPVIGDIIKVF